MSLVRKANTHWDNNNALFQTQFINACAKDLQGLFVTNAPKFKLNEHEFTELSEMVRFFHYCVALI